MDGRSVQITSQQTGPRGQEAERHKGPAGARTHWQAAERHAHKDLLKVHSKSVAKRDFGPWAADRHHIMRFGVLSQF